MGARSRIGLVATLGVSVAMLTAATVTVLDAGCADPGRLVARADGTTELVGGCVDADDLVVPGKPLPSTEPGPSGAAVRP